MIEFNVLEQKEAAHRSRLDVWLEVDEDGDLALVMRKGDAKQRVLFISAGNGNLWRDRGLPESLGLELDARGKIIVGDHK